MEYSSGEACPFEKIKWSLLELLGSAKSYLKCPASRTAISSAADMDDVGWPDPAAVLQRMLSIRSCWASSCHCWTFGATGAVRLIGFFLRCGSLAGTPA